MRCVRRGDKCSLVSASTSRSDASSSVSSTSSTSPRSAAEPWHSKKDDAFTLTDLKLFHHFTTTTCHYMAAPNGHSLWLDALPALALEHPFLLHELMALAAVDLSSALSATSEEESKAYLELARRHHARGLAGLMPAITSQSADLVTPVWACNALLTPYYFTTASDPASLLFNSDPPGPAEWMLPLRGSVTLFRTHEAVLLSGLAGTSLRPYRERCLEGRRAIPHNASEGPIAHMIARLQQRWPDDDDDSGATVVVTEEERPAMTGALNLLRECFATSDQGDALGRKTASLTFCAMAPGSFFELLGRRRPAALVVMAFWCLLLHRANQQGRWWLHVNQFNKVRDLLGHIHGLLAPEARDLISWPVQEIGLPGDPD